MAFTLDGKTLAAADFRGSIKLWDVATGKNTFEVKASKTKGCWTAAFSPDCKILATTPAGGVTLWDVATGKELAALKEHSETVMSIAFSPDGKRLATAREEDKTIKLWTQQRARLSPPSEDTPTK